MKNFHIPSILVLLGLVILFNYFRYYSYGVGDCVIAEDGYIWQIRGENNDKYFLEGWDGERWGLLVDMEKKLIERRGEEDFWYYRKTNCPNVIYTEN